MLVEAGADRNVERTLDLPIGGLYGNDGGAPLGATRRASFAWTGRATRCVRTSASGCAYSAFVSGDVSIAFRQAIGAQDRLRTGRSGTTLTVTRSATTP